MKLLAALTYIKRNHEALKEDGRRVIGVAHTPNDEQALYYIVEPKLHQVVMKGGFPLNDKVVESTISHHSLSMLVTLIPDFALDIDYQVCSLNADPFIGRIENGLHSIFPNLPSLDGVCLHEDDSAKSETLYDSNTGNIIPAYDLSLSSYNMLAARFIAKGNGQSIEPPATA